jgi:phosphoribulokinase
MEKPIKVLKSHRRSHAKPLQVKNLTENHEFVWHPNDFSTWKKLGYSSGVLRYVGVWGLTRGEQQRVMKETDYVYII